MQILFETTGPKISHPAFLLLCPVVLILIEEMRKWMVRRFSKNVRVV